MEKPEQPRGQGLAPWLTLAVILMAATLWLAVSRVYQVDEGQTVYMASILARGWSAALYTSGQLHLFPLSWLVRPGMDSAQLFLTFRLAFWALFWVNAVLAVVAAGLKLRSPAGLKGLAAVASLAPWWAYGLEIRHDNVLITGILLLWILGRRVPWRRTRVFFLLGVVALLLHACLFKSAATWVPLCALLLPGGRKRAWAPAGPWGPWRPGPWPSG